MFVKITVLAHLKSKVEVDPSELANYTRVINEQEMVKKAKKGVEKNKLSKLSGTFCGLVRLMVQRAF